MFDRKKKLVKPPKIDIAYILDLMLTQAGKPKIPRSLVDMFVLNSKNYYKQLDLTYLENYICPVIYLN